MSGRVSIVNQQIWVQKKLENSDVVLMKREKPRKSNNTDWIFRANVASDVLIFAHILYTKSLLWDLVSNILPHVTTLSR